MASETIAAIATPLGEGGVGVIRISGPLSTSIINRIFKTKKDHQLISHKVLHGWVIDGSKPIDEALMTYFKAPKSYTGEDIVEISCHGGISIVKAVLELALRAGARLAQKGEFTKRAFLNGRIDLTKAEAVIDIIKARTKESSIMAASHLKGSLSAQISGIRGRLMDILAMIEVSLDYPDEDVKTDKKAAYGPVFTAAKEVDSLIKTADTGLLFRDGLSAAIIGRPNVGKSSLLNALLKHERSIVAEEPGTTRDVIEEYLNIKGIPLKVIDTAGIRRSRNKVEKLGIDRAHKAMSNSDIVLLVIDISEPISGEDRELLEKTGAMNRLIVLNKSDKKHLLKASQVKHLAGSPVSLVSAKKGEGISDLEDAIYKTVCQDKVVAQNTEIMINLRQKQCLDRAKEHLSKAKDSINKGMQPDFISIDLKGAVAALGEVTGEVVSEEVIDSIFERFCVGK